MSIETRHLCDRCGAVIGGERSVLSGTGRPAAAAIGRGEFDMCGACAAALGEFLKPPVAAADEPGPTEADGE
jgi:hypothetical protein